MRLTEANPHWVGLGDKGELIIGITFKSPKTGHRIGVLFANPIDHDGWIQKIGNPMDLEEFFPDSKRWKRKGETFDSLTLEPSIDISERNEWHGRILNGELISC